MGDTLKEPSSSVSFCKHEPHKVISDIKAPRYSTDDILISTSKVIPSIEHYLIEFSDSSPKEEYGWFYLNIKDIKNKKKQKNGSIMVYVIPLSRRKKFIPKEECEHAD